MTELEFWKKLSEKNREIANTWKKCYQHAAKERDQLRAALSSAHALPTLQTPSQTGAVTVNAAPESGR